jgi:hypothetical protein
MSEYFSAKTKMFALGSFWSGLYYVIYGSGFGRIGPDLIFLFWLLSGAFWWRMIRVLSYLEGTN